MVNGGVFLCPQNRILGHLVMSDTVCLEHLSWALLKDIFATHDSREILYITVKDVLSDTRPIFKGQPVNKGQFCVLRIGTYA